jgi:hypothetical protein
MLYITDLFIVLTHAFVYHFCFWLFCTVLVCRHMFIYISRTRLGDHSTSKVKLPTFCQGSPGGIDFLIPSSFKIDPKPLWRSFGLQGCIFDVLPRPLAVSGSEDNSSFNVGPQYLRMSIRPPRLHFRVFARAPGGVDFLMTYLFRIDPKLLQAAIRPPRLSPEPLAVSISKSFQRRANLQRHICWTFCQGPVTVSIA